LAPDSKDMATEIIRNRWFKPGNRHLRHKRIYMDFLFFG